MDHSGPQDSRNTNKDFNFSFQQLIRIIWKRCALLRVFQLMLFGLLVVNIVYFSRNNYNTTSQHTNPVTRKGPLHRPRSYYHQLQHQPKITSTTWNEKKFPVETFLRVPQEDDDLAEFIRRELLVAPSKESYSLTHPEKLDFSQYRQSIFLITKILPGMKGGFFVEVGAMDGELYSNTLYLERELGWTGLLIEANPSAFQQLLSKHRKAWAINAAAAVNTYTSIVSYLSTGDKEEAGEISEDLHIGIKIKAIPLYSILKSMDRVIDFLSLDIQGQELKVLQTLPWNIVKIRVMCIRAERQELLSLNGLLINNGYKFLTAMNNHSWYKWDKVWFMDADEEHEEIKPGHM
ncbi:uncharacterized protein LOC121858624 isoform X2 [Homarus americanus]|uniref:uncharacterized protein LOC121858624 isoform X2 n=1 Tax=Homarus americanus TaxID=6706 RepID=UPI001C48299E|nr:uncharacterized protein LOC121858624 isoform X2 [Homarus americanus]